MRHHRRLFINDFVIITTVFFAILSFGLVYGLIHLRVGDQPAAVAVTAPTLADYHQGASSVLEPFLNQWPNVTSEALVSDNEPLKGLVVMTQERLLRLRVPAEAKDDHLVLVLLLDKWKRALAGSAADQRNVLEMTEQTVAGLAWLGR